MTIPTRILLFLAAITLIGVGGMIALAPELMYAGPGMAMPDNIVLTSDIRASGTFLLTCGMTVLAAAAGLIARRFALIISAIAFLSYGMGRVLSLGLDGMPDAKILTAAGIEWALGLAALAVLWSTRTRADTPNAQRAG